MVGIEALSYYFPGYSVKAREYVDAWGYFAGWGIREKTVASFDEDEVTMALEAASRLITGDVGYVAAATFGGPRISNTVVTALGLEGCRKADFSGSTNASGEAFLSCVDYVEASKGQALLITADMPRAAPEDPAEHGLGAASTALLITPDGGLKIGGTSAHTEEEYGELFLDSRGVRRSLEVVDLSRKVFRRSVEGLPEASEGKRRVACYEPDARFARRSLQGLVEASHVGSVVELSGDTGCSSPFLALMDVLQGMKEGEEVLLLTYGGGSSVAVVLRQRSAPAMPESPKKALASSRTYLTYLRYAQLRRHLSSQDVSTEMSMGAYISLPSYLESIEERYRLTASRCTSCSRLHFPPRHACLDCGGRTFSREPLCGEGEVFSYTVIARGSSPTEFREQQDFVGEYAVALVQLKEGPRIVAQMTDCDPDGVEIGLPVRAVLRRVYRQEGVVRYGYKFVPAKS